MKVKDLIEKLQQFDPELPVAVADWQEEYQLPSEKDAEFVNELNGRYLVDPNWTDIKSGSFICIGYSRKT